VDPAALVLLAQPYPHLVEIINRDLEHLRSIMMISEACILLCGCGGSNPPNPSSTTNFLATHSNTVCHILKKSIGQVRPKGVTYCMLVLEALLRRYPTDGGSMLMQSGIVGVMLQSAAEHYCCVCVGGLNSMADDVRRQQQWEPECVIVQYLTVIARIVAAASSPDGSRGLDSMFPIVISARDHAQKQQPQDPQPRFEFQPLHLIDLYFRLVNACDFDENGALYRRIWLIMMISFLPTEQQSQQTLSSCSLFSSACSQHIVETHMDGLIAILVKVLRDEEKWNLTERQQQQMPARLLAVKPYSLGYNDCDEDYYDEEITTTTAATAELMASKYDAIIRRDSELDVAQKIDIRNAFQMKMNLLMGAGDTYFQNKLSGGGEMKALIEDLQRLMK